ncbi:unnamed protein product [Cunninghamella echinulata]
MNNNNSQYYTYQHYPPQIYHASPRQHRVRTQSNPTKSPVQPQKSSSTPNSPHPHRQRKPRSIENNNNNNNHRRPSKPTINDRRPSKPTTTTTTTTNLYNHNNTSASVCSTTSSITSSSIHNNNKSPSIDSSSGRRSSITSTTSNKSQAVSIRSEMSIGGSKLSLSKRLKKAFSISNLRSSSSLSLSSSSLGSLDGASSSNVSISTIDVIHENSTSSPSTSTPPQRNLRRRSLASLSSLFQKNKSSSSLTSSSSPISTPPSLSPSTSQSTRRPSITPSLNQKQQEDKKDRPTLRVDTSRPVVTNNQRKPPIKGRSSVIAPDSPNSSISTRSPVTKVVGPHRLAELPSPTPSASSSSSSQQQQQNNEIDLSMAPPPVIGVHYGLPMHGSPRLKPAASSSASSLIIMDNQNTNSKRRLQFCPTVQVHETFAASDYDRRCDNNSTCQKLTPMIAMKIKQELNEYKLTEMEVHVDSRQYTHFFL